MQLIQTLQITKPCIRYFPVRRICPDTVVPDQISLIQSTINKANEQDKERHFQRHQSIIDKGGKDTPWLNYTGWKRQFAETDMAKLIAMTRLELADEEIWLKNVGRQVCEMIENAYLGTSTLNFTNEGVLDCERRGWSLVGFWMNSTRSNEPHRRPFRNHKLQATRERYSKTWARLILFCLRTFESDSSNCQFNEKTQEQLQELLQAIHLDAPESTTTKKLLELSISLITQSDYDGEYSVIKYFSGILGYSAAEARWQTPKEYTPVLARILFCMQVLGLEYSLPSAERDTMNTEGDNAPHARLNLFRSKWLVEDEPTPFNTMHKLLNYGLTAAKDGFGFHWIRIDAAEKWLYYKGEKLSISQLREFQHTILRKADEVLSRSLLFRTSRNVKDINPYQFVHEDFSNLDTDYFFADVIPDWREKNRHILLKDLKANSSRWNKLVDNDASIQEGHIVWRTEGIKEYEKMATQFLEYILVAMNMQGGQSGRGEEMVSTTYKNTPEGERNLKIESGQMVLETVYHKSQAIMDSLKVLFSETHTNC